MVEVSDTGIGLETDQLTPSSKLSSKVSARSPGNSAVSVSASPSPAVLWNCIGARSRRAAMGRIEAPRSACAWRGFPRPPRIEGAPQPSSDNGSGLRILLVDDHSDTRTILTRLLTRKGFRMQSAGSVEEGRALLRASAFDVLISDIGLPDGSGLELVEEAKRRYPALHAIALSGFGMEDDLAQRHGWL